MDRSVGRRAAALVVAAISISACSTAEQPTPTSPPPADIATLPEPTQTPFPDGVFPIATGYGLLLGGSSHGEWLDAETVHDMFMGEKIDIRAYDGINPPVDGSTTS